MNSRMRTTGRITDHQRITVQLAEKRLQALLARLTKKLPVWEGEARRTSGEIDSLVLNSTILFWRLGHLRVAKGEVVDLMTGIAVSLKVLGKPVALPFPRIAALVSQIKKIDRAITSINKKTRAPGLARKEARGTKHVVPSDFRLARNPIGSARNSDPFLAGPNNDDTMAYLRRLTL